MSFRDTVMRINYSAEARAEAEAYWARVREGLHRSEPHEFSDDGREQAIERHRYLANRAIQTAAEHMRAAYALSAVEVAQ